MVKHRIELIFGARTATDENLDPPTQKGDFPGSGLVSLQKCSAALSLMYAAVTYLYTVTVGCAFQPRCSIHRALV